MTAASVTERGRRRAESIMIDTCTITRDGGDGPGEFDEETGQSVPPDRVPVYSGRCRTKARDVGSHAQEAAGETVTVMAYVVSIPWDTTGVEVGDLVTITASHDPGAVRDLVVAAVEAATFLTARRLICSDQG